MALVVDLMKWDTTILNSQTMITFPCVINHLKSSLIAEVEGFYNYLMPLVRRLWELNNSPESIRGDRKEHSFFPTLTLSIKFGIGKLY